MKKTDFRGLLERLRFIATLVSQGRPLPELIEEERHLQAACIAWLHAHEDRRLHESFSIANESPRTSLYGAVLKAMGMRAGVADLFIPALSGLQNEFEFDRRAGLFVELKHGSSARVSREQKVFIEAMRYCGYGACVCRSFEDFTRAVTLYLSDTELFAAFYET